MIFTRNTTDSLNLLASALPEGAEVLSFPLEHHANLLPWRKGGTRYLPMPLSAADALGHLDTALRSARSRHTLVSVTGASNVTGEVWPLREIADLAHRHGAHLLVDAAQLAPHVPIDMTATGIDYLAFSGHKLHAPYGAGVLVGRADVLGAGDPFLRGGGAVKFVTLDQVLWADLPDRQEAGSPNVVGAVALGVAAQTLMGLGMTRCANDERDLRGYALGRLRSIPGVKVYGLWDDDHPHVGLLTFNLAGYRHNQLAAILSAEYGIGVRHGCFCAHPLLAHLLKLDSAEITALQCELMISGHARLPGAVRISMGLGTTRDEIDYFSGALEHIASDGPAWSYRLTDADDYVPDPDPRAWPDLGIPLAAHGPASSGESS